MLWDIEDTAYNSLLGGRFFNTAHVIWSTVMNRAAADINKLGGKAEVTPPSAASLA